MYNFRSENSGRAASALTDDADQDDWISRWGNGFGFASIPFVIGIMAMTYRSCWFIGGKPIRLVRYGDDQAVAIGVMYLGVALFMNAHYFWSASNRYYFVSQLLKPAALLILICSVSYVAVDLVVVS